MTSLHAIVPQNEGCGIIPSDGEPSFLDLLQALRTVDVVGRQMFERDSLCFVFDCWATMLAQQPGTVNPQFTAGDVLANITDIRTLPQTCPDIENVDPELLAATTAIEQFVRARMLSMH